MPGIPLRPACSSDSVFDRSRKRWRWCFAVGSERLDIVRLLIGQVMACDIEMESAAERDVESLQSFADRENRKPAFARLLDCVEFPAIAIGIHILFDYRGIGNRLV